MERFRMVGEACTCCGDVVELISCEEGGLSFSLCKILLLDDVLRGNSDQWVYALIMKDDKFPILISHHCAKTILDDPKSGIELVRNRRFDRYR